MARNNRDDVIAAAVRVLDEYGLGDLTMRRLAAELDVRPSALYHHFGDKQALLAAVADTILERVPLVDDDDSDQDWLVRLRVAATRLRDTLLCYRDGAEVVATVQAYGLGRIRPDRRFAEVLTGAGLDPATAATAARTLVFFVFGHATEEQLHVQAGSAGAIADPPRPDSDFGPALEMVLAGIAARVALVH